MGRPQKLPTDEVVRRATMLLWSVGYRNCSLEQLERATEMDRRGLYNLFGSKKGLLLAALEYYRTTVVAPHLGPLERSDAGYRQIESVFRSLALAWDQDLPDGCFVCNTAREEVANDPEVAAEIERYWDSVLGPFTQAISRAKRAGEIRNTSSASALSAYLLTVLQGVCVLERTTISPALVKSSVRVALQTLR